MITTGYHSHEEVCPISRCTLALNPQSPMPTAEITPGPINNYPIRGQKVLLDAGLAALCDVETLFFNQPSERNREYLSEDFMPN